MVLSQPFVCTQEGTSIKNKFVLYEEDSLNPIRAGVVKTMSQLATYRWTGHAVIVGRAKKVGSRQEGQEKGESRQKRTWQEVDTDILSLALG